MALGRYDQSERGEQQGEAEGDAGDEVLVAVPVVLQWTSIDRRKSFWRETGVQLCREMASLFRLAFVASAALFVGCSRAPIPTVDPVGLTVGDIEVLRTVIDGALRSRLIDKEAKGLEIIIQSPTRRIALWREPPRAAGTLPEAPAPFGRPRPNPPPPPSAAIEERLLTPAERSAWTAANRRALEVPELALAGFTIGTTEFPRPGRIYVTVSAPAYPTSNSAVVYADYFCGGTCGEGWLVRVFRTPRVWLIRRADRLWIS